MKVEQIQGKPGWFIVRDHYTHSHQTIIASILNTELEAVVNITLDKGAPPVVTYGQWFCMLLDITTERITQAYLMGAIRQMPSRVMFTFRVDVEGRVVCYFDGTDRVETADQLFVTLGAWESGKMPLGPGNERRTVAPSDN